MGRGQVGHYERVSIIIKFTDNADLKKKLLDSNDLKFAEAGLDPFYGIGLTVSSSDIFDPEKWEGKYHFGTILESVRASLKVNCKNKCVKKSDDGIS